MTSPTPSHSLQRQAWLSLNKLAAFAALAALAGVQGCATPPPAGPISPERIAAILASPDRTSADRTNDLRRKPAETLAFIGVRPGMVALDLSAGGGYTSELLARAIGSNGWVYGQSQSRDPLAAAPAAPEGNSHPGLPSGAPSMPVLNSASAVAALVAGPRPSPIALAERNRRLQASGQDAAPIRPIVQRFDNPVPSHLVDAQIDLATLMFNYHDLGHMGVDRAKMNRAVFQALKPGGIYVIADHAGRPGTGMSEAGTLHRVEEDFVAKEVQAVGFKLMAAGDFLRNPNDPRDKNTPAPPQPKDEFVLKFIKP
jgi:predicted methyltransferase